MVDTPTGDLVTRWSKLQTLGIGLAISTFVIALIPGLVWLLNAFVPFDYRPPAMQDSNVTAWWMVAVAIAVVLLLLRRREFFARLGGPAVGDQRPEHRVDSSVRSGVRLAARSALRGSIPMLFPLYVVLVAALADSGGMSWPDDVFSTWGVCWLLMPVACVFLAVRSIVTLRLRMGAMLMSTAYAIGSALAAGLFVAYPLVA